MGVSCLQEDNEIAAAVDAEMRERLGESDDSDADDEGGSAPNDRSRSQSRATTPASEGEDDAQLQPAAAAAAGKGKKARQQQQQQRQGGDAAGAAGGYGKGRTVRSSLGGKKADDPLLNYVVTEDGRSCNVEVSQWGGCLRAVVCCARGGPEVSWQR
jgi:hypothetical protein